MRKARRLILLLIVAVTMVLLGNHAIASKIPTPTGPYPVGRTECIWTDSTRDDPWLLDKRQKREIKVYLWYPAAKSDAPAATYFPDLPKLDKFQFLERAVLGKVTFDALESPPVAPGPFPVIAFSPGKGNSTAYYAGIIEELVSWGYLVAAIEHTHEGPGQVLSGGLVATNLSEKAEPKPGIPDYAKVAAAYLAKVINIRSQDFSFVLNQLGELNRSDARFKGKLLMNKAATLGHSLGGMSAAQAALNDHRFIAAVNLDGLTYGRSRLPSEPGEEMLATFLQLGKPLKQLTDEDLKKDGVTRTQSDAAEKRLSLRADAVLKEVKGGAYRVLIQGAVHRAFSDDPFIDPSLQSQQRVLPIVRPILVEFFDMTLRGAKRLKLGSPKPFEGVTVEWFGKAAPSR